jgi:hypothetical protein
MAMNDIKTIKVVRDHDGNIVDVEFYFVNSTEAWTYYEFCVGTQTYERLRQIVELIEQTS